MSYSIVKIGRKFAVYDSDGNGIVCLKTKRDCERWIERSHRQAVEMAEYRAQLRAYRLGVISTYLVTRATRPVQLKLF
jgi:hypothetical protein